MSDIFKKLSKYWQLRWLVFLLLGYPLQLLVFIVYPFACLLFLLTQYKPKSLKWPKIPAIPKADRHSQLRDGIFLANTDDHGAFTHLFMWLSEKGRTRYSDGMHLLMGNGEMCCRFLNSTRDYHKVSGDVAVFNMHALAILHEYYGLNDNLKNQIIENAKTYLKYLGFRSNNTKYGLAVSARCNNFGLNICTDGWAGLGQPAFGPQFYTSAAVLSMAAKFGGFKWKLIYCLHWWLMGGWLWWVFPVLYTKKDKLAYVRDVTIRAANTIKLSGMGTWCERWVHHYITDTVAETKNPMHWALRGELDLHERHLPEVINPWCFQTIDCANGDELSANTYTRDALYVIDEINRRF